MRRFLLLLVLVSLMLVIFAAVAHADYWPPDAPPVPVQGPQLHFLP